MKYGALQHTLETQRRLHLAVVVFGQQRCLLIDALGQLAPQFGDIRVAGLQNLVDPGNIEQREQQVLHRHEFMTAITGSLKSLVQTKFQLTAEHPATPVMILP